MRRDIANSCAQRWIWRARQEIWSYLGFHLRGLKRGMDTSNAVASSRGPADWQLMLCADSLKSQGRPSRASMWSQENICGMQGCSSGAPRPSWKTFGDFSPAHTPRLPNSRRLSVRLDMHPRCGEFIRALKIYPLIMP